MPEQTDPYQAIKLEIREWVAIITIDVPKKLNALTQACYFRIAYLLDEIANNDKVVVTLIVGKGRFFSAGADVSSANQIAPDASASPEQSRLPLVSSFVALNLHNTHAWYTHPKILVVALNGPAIGISAAYVAHADFVYAAPHAYLAVPFTSLGLVAEGGSSKALVDRMGLAKANELLFTSRKMSSEELVKCNFVNKVFTEGGGDKETGKGQNDEKFINRVVEEIHERLGTHLNHYSMLKIKRLIREPGMAAMDRAGVSEVMGGMDVFLRGAPQREFRRIFNGEKRHKL